jgi:DUF971 family protein
MTCRRARTWPQRLEVVFEDGPHISLPAEYLRVMSPSADTQTRVVSGRRHVAIMGAEAVGNYAVRSVHRAEARRADGHGVLDPANSRWSASDSHVLRLGTCRLKFDDLHHSGIYSWSMLKDLSDNKVGADV